MRWVLCNVIPAKPNIVWRWITEPKRINRWATAKVQIAQADNRTADDAALTVSGSSIRSEWEEAVFDESDENPSAEHRLAYRIVGEDNTTIYRGVLKLSPCGNHTELRWEVDYPSTRLGLSWLSGWRTRRRMKRSLEHLARIVQHVEE